MAGLPSATALKGWAAALGLAASLWGIAAGVRSEEVPAADLVERLSRSIVAIEVTPVNAPVWPQPAASADLRPDTPALPSRPLLGSGLIVSPDGVVLTDCSMFDKPSAAILVHLHAGARQKALLIGLDKQTCLALLKVPKEDLPFVALHHVNDLRAGEPVLALGRTVVGGESPVTVTQGLVSTVFDGTGGLEPVIQSSVAMLPPLGGGPLVRLRTGEVIGVNAFQFVSKSGESAGAFAVPISTYLKNERDLRTLGHIERSMIGIRGATVPEEMPKPLSYPGRGGVLVQVVAEGSAAQAAGIDAGDIVLEADGLAATSVTQLFAYIQGRRPGTDIRLKIFRHGKTVEIDVKTTRLERR
jgi:serine protease Do